MAWGSLMRHFLRRGLLGSLAPALPIAGLASRVPVTAPPAFLVAPPRSP
ncbi:MAG TPA: hypothetical protein VHG32_02080 [Thermoanaerobaculia bacterium]|jgi:hypothetical protein|nr:hypothetical protein [Thermoanaerobaculia bacterium]